MPAPRPGVGLSNVLPIKALKHILDEVYFGEVLVLPPEDYLSLSLQIADHLVDLVGKFGLIVPLHLQVAQEPLVFRVELQNLQQELNKMGNKVLICL